MSKTVIGFEERDDNFNSIVITQKIKVFPFIVALISFLGLTFVITSLAVDRSGRFIFDVLYAMNITSKSGTEIVGDLNLWNLVSIVVFVMGGIYFTIRSTTFELHTQ